VKYSILLPSSEIPVNADTHIAFWTPGVPMEATPAFLLCCPRDVPTEHFMQEFRYLAGVYCNFISGYQKVIPNTVNFFQDGSTCFVSILFHRNKWWVKTGVRSILKKDFIFQ